MSLTFTKKQRAKVAEVLDQDYESIDEAATAVLEATAAILEERAKFVVVGQLKATRERVSIPPSDPEAIKLALGWYATEGDARKAAESLWHSNASGDSFRTWVLNVHWGTPAEWHTERKLKYQELEAKQNDARQQRIKDSILKGEERNRQRIEEIRAIEAKAGGQGWPCPQSRIKSNGCEHDPKCK